MLLRISLQLENNSLGNFTFEGKSAKEQTQFKESYSGSHIAVFEAALKIPPQLSKIDHNFVEYLKAHKLQFRNFKLVDLDNYMNGNHHFSKLADENEWQATMDQVMSLAPVG